MRRIHKIVLFVLLASLAGYAQSLGDVARDTRAKEKAKGAAKKKVITNEEIPESPDANPGPRETERDIPAVASTSSGARSPEDWKSQILAQKNAVTNLKAQIEKLNSSVHFVEANAYVNGVQYNQHQVKKQQQVEQMRSQLAEQQKQLETMQDAAKKAGMGSAVYDP